MVRTTRTRPDKIELQYVSHDDPRSAGGLTMRQGSDLLTCLIASEIPHKASFSPAR
jgi:hypothetical protein